ncbi:MAG: toll/interleukin-1 receptor domain-containing protein [Bacteroidota bacterium]
MTSKIFISYRRRDTPTATDKLCEFLTEKFSSSYHIFRGVDRIPDDSDFVNKAKKAIDESAIVLIVIGRHFLTEVEKDGGFLQEIAHALKKQEKVISILVNNANRPVLRALPEEIEQLSTTKYFEVDHINTATAYLKLYEFLDGILSQSNVKSRLNLHIIGQLRKARVTFKEKNYREAFIVYHKFFSSAKEFSVEDQANLGYMYLHGNGVNKDCQEAWKWSYKAAEKGNATGQFCIGKIFYAGCDRLKKNYKESMKWFKEAAEQGHAKAQRYIGLLYDYGRGVEQDYQQAMIWYRRASDQGDAEAQCDIGFLYHHGRGVKQDWERAMIWYKKAADQGDARAQNNVGFLYNKGKGVEQDYQQAMYWYHRAAGQSKTANYNLGVLYENENDIPKDLQQAIYWYERAADLGHEKAAKRVKRLRAN